MVKIKKLEIENFLSIADLTLEFDEYGVFHFDGNHNIGKSNIIKAINTLFRNVNNLKYTKYIRDNETTFRLTGTFYDGGVVTLSRGEEDYYEWSIPSGGGIAQGMTTGRTNGQVPDELVKYFNLYIDNEKTKECLNVRLPRDPLLYVDTTGGDSYYLMQQALGTEEFIQATRLANKKRGEIKKDITKTQERLTREEDILGDTKRKYVSYEQEHNVAKGIVETIESNLGEYNDLLEVVTLTTEVIKIQEEIDAKSGFNLPDGFGTLPREILEVESIEDLLREKRNLRDISKEYTELQTALDSVDVTSIAKELEELELIEGLLRDKKEVQELNKEIVEIDIDLVELQDNIKEVEILANVIADYKELQKLQQDYNKLNEEYLHEDKLLGEYMVENKFCPIVAMRSDRTCPFSTEIKL